DQPSSAPVSTATRKAFSTGGVSSIIRSLAGMAGSGYRLVRRRAGGGPEPDRPDDEPCVGTMASGDPLRLALERRQAAGWQRRERLDGDPEAVAGPLARPDAGDDAVDDQRRRDPAGRPRHARQV